MPRRRRPSPAGSDLSAMFEGPDADVRKRKRRIRGIGLGLTPNEAAVDTLQLPPDPGSSFFQIDVIPRQTEQLASPKPEHEHQHDNA